MQQTGKSEQASFCSLSTHILCGSSAASRKFACLFNAPVVELVDTYGSGPYGHEPVQVRVLPGAPNTLACGVIGNAADSGSAVLGSSPSGPTKQHTRGSQAGKAQLCKSCISSVRI